MSQVDLLGTQAVCDFIMSSHMAIFYIHRYPSQSGQLPVYEYTKPGSVQNAVSDFRQWANIVNNGQQNTIQYQITVTNFQEGEDLSDTKKRKVQKMRASFVFHSEKQNVHVGAAPTQEYGKNYFDEKLAALKTELELKAKIKELTETVEDLEDELAEVGSNPQDKFLSKLIDKWDEKDGKKKKDPALAAPGNKEEIIKSLNNSIKILWKHDPELHLHLEKLANTAQNKPTKFKMILEMLETHL